MYLSIFYFFEIKIKDSSLGHFVGVELNKTEATRTLVDFIKSHMELLHVATLRENSKELLLSGEEGQIPYINSGRILEFIKVLLAAQVYSLRRLTGFLVIVLLFFLLQKS